MSITTTTLENDIRLGIQKAADKLKEEIANEAVRKFDREIRKLIGNASVDLANYFSVQRMGADLVITVKIDSVATAERQEG